LDFHRYAKLLSDSKLIGIDAGIGLYDFTYTCIVEEGDVSESIAGSDGIRDGTAWTLSVISIGHANHPKTEYIYIIFYMGG